MSITITHSCVEKLIAETGFKALIESYADESAIAGMPRPDAQFEMYRELEAGGMLRVLVAKDGDQVIGFMVLLETQFMHYGQLVVTTESYYVDPSFRSTGAGLQLLRVAEQHARDIGAAGFFVSAPVGSRLETVLPRVGYRATNTVFFRQL